MPTRVYPSPERLLEMPLRPKGFCRKVVEIGPDLVALWSGNGGLATKFARRARDWFEKQRPTEDEMRQFLSACCHDLTEGLWVIMVSALTPVYFMVGSVVHASAPFVGEYTVAGNGKEIFISMVNEMPAREEGGLEPAMDALRIASDLLAREIVTKDTIISGFGGAYEVLYQGPGGFERVNDVMYALARVNLKTMDIGHYSHALRQWYEGNQLCIASTSNPVAHRQGVESMRFEIPDILGQPSHSTRTIDTLTTAPQYLCIHYMFETEGRFLPSTMIMRGDAIEQNFTLSLSGRELTFEPTAAYMASVRERAEQMRNQMH